MGFQVSAIIILVMFYGCYFIKLISQKKKGIQTDQMGKGKQGLAKFIETTMKLTIIYVVIIELNSIFLNTTCLPMGIRLLGGALGAFAVALFITSVLTMKDSWRAGVSKKDKTELITGGIYQISRNPAFLSFDLLFLGVLLMFFNWVLFITSLFTAFMFHLQIIKVEEKFLVGAFGDDYLDYKKEVNRYFGRKIVKQ